MVDTSNTTVVAIEACYYLASFLFIMALQGLSNQQSAKYGNWFGIYGMLIAILMTFFFPDYQASDFGRFCIAFFPGGLIGLLTAKKVH